MRGRQGLSVEQTDLEDVVRLEVTGELDLATAPELEYRLRRLRTRHVNVRLNLSRLEFVDVAGARTIARVLAEAGADGWLELEPELSATARRVFELVDLPGLVSNA